MKLKKQVQQINITLKKHRQNIPNERYATLI
jgi:hypothetical protein